MRGVTATAPRTATPRQRRWAALLPPLVAGLTLAAVGVLTVGFGANQPVDNASTPPSKTDRLASGGPPKKAAAVVRGAAGARDAAVKSLPVAATPGSAAARPRPAAGRTGLGAGRTGLAAGATGAPSPALLQARLRQQRVGASTLSQAIAALRAAESGAHIGGPKLTAALNLLAARLTEARRNATTLTARLAAAIRAPASAARTNAAGSQPRARRSPHGSATAAAVRPVVAPSTGRARAVAPTVSRLAPVTARPAGGAGADPGAIAVAYARAQIGKPYRWGGAGPWAFDCSGLTMRAWEAAGVHLPHLAAAQLHAGIRVSRAELRPGDLVILDGASHVELYVGGGQVIEAPHRGAVVRYAPLPASNVTAYVRPRPAV